MKRTVIFSFLFPLFVLPNLISIKPPWVIQPNRPTPPPQPTITRVPIPTKKAEIKARLTERRQRLIQAFFDRMVKRLEAAIARLEKLISRIQSRLDKIEAEGIDVSAIQEDINRATSKLNEAKADLATAQASIEEMLSAEDPKAAFANVRTAIRAVKNDLIEVHRILVHLIGDIRGLRVGQEEGQPMGTPAPTEEPTTTPTPTTEPTPTPLPTL